MDCRTNINTCSVSEWISRILIHESKQNCIYYLGYSNSKVAKEIKQSGFCYPMNPVLASITFLVSLAALGVVIYEFYCMQVEGDFVRMKKWMYAFNYANAIGTGILLMVVVSEYTRWICKELDSLKECPSIDVMILKYDELQQNIGKIKNGFKYVLMIGKILNLYSNTFSFSLVRHLSVIVSILLSLYYNSSLLQDTHKDHLNLATFLRRQLLKIESCDSLKTEVEIVVAEIFETEPFTAMGFFNIERSCLISLMATSITYVIVLLQGGFNV